MKSRFFIALGVLACLMAAPLFAHHSFAMFDRNRKVVLEGEVREFQWTNPHAWIQVVVLDGKGGKVEWGVECGSPNMMARSGWKSGTLKPGDKVTLEVNPLLNGRTNGSLVKITLADGRTLGPGGAPPPRVVGSNPGST